VKQLSKSQANIRRKMFKQPKGLVVYEPQAASPSVMWYKKSRHFQLTEKEYNKERKEGVQKWCRNKRI